MMSLSLSSESLSLQSSSQSSSSLLEINAHGLLIVSTNVSFVNDEIDNSNEKSHCNKLSFLLTVEDASLQDACPINTNTNATTKNGNPNNDDITNNNLPPPPALFHTQEVMRLNDGNCPIIGSHAVITKTILIPLCRPTQSIRHGDIAAMSHSQTRSLLVTLWQTTASSMLETNDNNSMEAYLVHSSNKPLTRRLVTLPKMISTTTIQTMDGDSNNRKHELQSPIATLELQALVSWKNRIIPKDMLNPIATTTTTSRHSSFGITIWDLLVILVPLWYSRRLRSYSSPTNMTRQDSAIVEEDYRHDDDEDEDYEEEEESTFSDNEEEDEEDSISLESSASAREESNPENDEDSSSLSQEQLLVIPQQQPPPPQDLDFQDDPQEAIVAVLQQAQQAPFQGDPLEVLRLVQEMLHHQNTRMVVAPNDGTENLVQDLAEPLVAANAGTMEHLSNAQYDQPEAAMAPLLPANGDNSFNIPQGQGDAVAIAPPPVIRRLAMEPQDLQQELRETTTNQGSEIMVMHPPALMEQPLVNAESQPDNAQPRLPNDTTGLLVPQPPPPQDQDRDALEQAHRVGVAKQAEDFTMSESSLEEVSPGSPIVSACLQGTPMMLPPPMEESNEVLIATTMEELERLCRAPQKDGNEPREAVNEKGPVVSNDRAAESELSQKKANVLANGNDESTTESEDTKKAPAVFNSHQTTTNDSNMTLRKRQEKQVDSASPSKKLESSLENNTLNQQVHGLVDESNNDTRSALQDSPTDTSKDGDFVDDVVAAKYATDETMDTDPFESTFKRDVNSDDDKSNDLEQKKEADMSPPVSPCVGNDLSQQSLDVIDFEVGSFEERKNNFPSLRQPSQESPASSQDVDSAVDKNTVDELNHEPTETKVAATVNDSSSPAKHSNDLPQTVAQSKQAAVHHHKSPNTPREDNESYVSTLPPDSDYNSIADVAWHSRRQRREEQSRASDVSILTAPDMKVNEGDENQARAENHTPPPATKATTKSSRPKMEKLLSRKRYRETEPASPEITIIENLSSLPKKPRPFRHSNIVPDWVPSNGLQSVSSQFATEDYSWDKKRSATKQNPSASAHRATSVRSRASSSGKERVRSRRKSHGGSTASGSTASIQKK